MNYQKVIHLDAQQCIPTMNFLCLPYYRSPWVVHTLRSIVLGSSEDILGT